MSIIVMMFIAMIVRITMFMIITGM